jgi:predicted nucleic acid-binding protein
MVIVDTTVWIDYLHGIASPEAAWLDHELSQQRLGLTDLILCEVLRGIRQEAAFRRVQSKLQNFEVFATGGAELAVATARN